MNANEIHNRHYGVNAEGMAIKAFVLIGDCQLKLDFFVKIIKVSKLIEFCAGVSTLLSH